MEAKSSAAADEGSTSAFEQSLENMQGHLDLDQGPIGPKKKKQAKEKDAIDQAHSSISKALQRLTGLEQEVDSALHRSEGQRHAQTLREDSATYSHRKYVAKGQACGSWQQQGGKREGRKSTLGVASAGVLLFHPGPAEGVGQTQQAQEEVPEG